MRETRLLGKRRHRLVSTADGPHGLGRFPNPVQGVKASRRDQFQVAEITYCELAGDDAFLASARRQFSCATRGCNPSRSLGRELTSQTLNEALQRNSAPVIHRPDFGEQYAANILCNHCITPARESLRLPSVRLPQIAWPKRRFAQLSRKKCSRAINAACARRNGKSATSSTGSYCKKPIQSALDDKASAESETQWIHHSTSKCPVTLRPENQRY